jgi:phage I-like protein
MKPLDRYKALISEAFGASEKLDSISIDEIIEQARNSAKAIVADQHLDSVSADQVWGF